MLNRKAVWNSLSTLWHDDAVPTLETKGKKYAILSDIHLGNGGRADDFHRNEQVFLDALDHYKDNEYTLILLGDIEELWQFDLCTIIARYGNTVYSKMKQIGETRIRRVFGNHDYEWGGFEDPARTNGKQPGLADEALKLKDRDGNVRFLLVHGHQGSIESDKYAWFSRFWARIFKGIEPVARRTGLYRQRSATKSQVTKSYERTLYSWTKENKVILICGHSHRAIFASKSYADRLLDKIAELKAENAMRGTRKPDREANYRKIAQLEREWGDEKEKGRVIESADPDNEPLPCYFNCGCGLYTDGITLLEIDGALIKLVKWERGISGVTQFKVYKSGNLDDFVDRVTA